jgi:outer membrane protein TolC
MENKQEVGQVSMQDVYLARADRDKAQDALRQAIGGQKQVQRALEILVGRYPSAEIEAADELIPVPPPIPVGVPVDIIQRRPDLVAAEARVASAFYLTEQAELAKLPSFTLSASVGGSSDLDDVIGNLGAGLFAPLFTGGALEAQVEQATADQEAAIAAYGQSLLEAFEEVETALTNEGLFAEREDYLRSSEENSRKAYDMSRARFDVGQTDLLSVLQIQAQWVGARVGAVNIKNDRLTQRVDLHLALGGSFETAPQ